MSGEKSQDRHLVRGLGLKEAIALVVGSIIGTGIFLKTGIISQTVLSPWLVMLAWTVAGLLSLAGALTYAELGGLFPKAGGEYVYLKEAYGSLTAFLYGWMRFWIGAPGSIAAYGVGAATFLSGMITFSEPWMKTAVAISFVLFFTALNCLTVKFGGALQTFLTALKVLILLVIVGGIFFLSPGTNAHFQVPTEWTGWSAFGAALLAALWAYDGWNNLPMVAGEVKNAQKNVPLALALGTVLILLIYGVVNYSYFYALPFSEVLTSSSKLYPQALPVATKAAATFLGVGGVAFLSIAFLISALGAMNGSVLTGARVPYAMAKDGLFFQRLGWVSPNTHVPVTAVWAQGIWACVLALSGTFDQLTDYVVFSSWLFYTLCGVSVFIFRRRLAHLPRSYRVWGYPWVPVIFILCAALLLLNTLWTNPAESFLGLIIIVIGIPVYWFVFRHRETSN